VPQDESDLQRLQSMLKTFDRAMLVTRRDGALRARPMAIVGITGGSRLWFFTSLHSGKLDELNDDPNVNVALQDGGRFCSITGHARVFADRRKAEEFWTEAQRAWFPDGPADSSLVLLEVLPDYAEYWDRSGLTGLRFLFAAAKARTEGERLDDDVGRHAKIPMER
jgi:general stress protein 26